MSTNAPYSFFKSVEKSFDKASKFTNWENGLLEQIKACNSVYSMRFPVKMDDGRIEVIEAYRVQHSQHKSPCKGGIRFSEEVNQDALDVLNTRGKICLFASAHPVTPFSIDPNLMHNRETSAVGVVSADRRDHAVATNLIATGQIDLSPIIDATFPILDAAEAFHRATSAPSYRVMLNP